MYGTNIVNAVWIGDEVPIGVRVCAGSWLYYGFEYHLWTYGKLRKVPQGVVVRNAREVLDCPIHRYMDKRHEASPVLQANLFRYKFLADRGGVVIDADTLCLSENQPTTCIAISSETVANGPHPNLAYISVPPSVKEIGKEMYDLATSRLNAKTWGRFGPAVVKQVVEQMQLQAAVLSPSAFCQICYSQAQKFFDKKPPSLPKTVLGVQMWQETLRQMGVDLESKFPETSLWETWRNKYGDG